MINSLIRILFASHSHLFDSCSFNYPSLHSYFTHSYLLIPFFISFLFYMNHFNSYSYFLTLIPRHPSFHHSHFPLLSFTPLSFSPLFFLTFLSQNSFFHLSYSPSLLISLSPLFFSPHRIQSPISRNDTNNFWTILRWHCTSF
jgi:hypothetical protein